MGRRGATGQKKEGTKGNRGAEQEGVELGYRKGNGNHAMALKEGLFNARKSKWPTPVA